MLYNIKILYLCTVFFMVLDLRLTMKIGCRDDNLFFFIYLSNHVKPRLSRSLLKSDNIPVTYLLA